MPTFRPTWGLPALVLALAAAKAEPNVDKHIAGKTIRKEIYVPGKLVNIVAN